MATIPGNIDKMQTQESDKKSVRSERYFQKLGGNINALLQKAVFDIGDVLPSILDETAFQSQNGTKWVACDGQSIEPSELSSLTGLAFAPDMRGKFPIQVNEDTTGVDANRSLGSSQTNNNKVHSHNLFSTNTTGLGFLSTLASVVVSVGVPTIFQNQNVQSSTKVPDVQDSETVGQTSTAGSGEFRPTNIAFYYYIKKNN